MPNIGFIPFFLLFGLSGLEIVPGASALQEVGVQQGVGA